MNELKFDNMSDTSSVAEKKKNWESSLLIMKERLQSRSGQGTSEGIREMILYHGLKLTSSTSLIGDFIEICYCNNSQEYLALDTNFTIHRFSMQGKPIQPPFKLSSSMGFTKIMWYEETSAFLCYIPHDDLIWLLTLDCKLIQVIRNEFRVENVFYVPNSNEMIVVGPTKVTRFPLERKEQTLNSWKTINMIDSAAGPMWQIDCSSLIQYEPQFLRLVGSYLTTIYIIPLHSEKDEESNVPVKFIAKKMNASPASITALHFHPTSQWIISGDQQGNIFGWNLDLNMVMSGLDGHAGFIKSIISHPSICGFISSSEDNVLQVWSCNLREKIESFKDIGEVFSMALNEAVSSVATLGAKLNCFYMHQLYNFYSPLTAEARKLFSTMSSIHPTRVIVSSEDNIVSILSSASGRQLNVQILPSNSEVISSAYSRITDSLYNLTKDDISISNVEIRPMKIRETWPNHEGKITCIVVFDNFEEIRGYDGEPQNPRVIHPISMRIIVGTCEGELISIEESSGRYESKFVAHDGPVRKLRASSTSKQIISIGEDKCVKVWRIFPNIKKCLVLLDCVYYTVPITLVAPMSFTVCIVSSTDTSSSHKLFMYNVMEGNQIQHHSSKDHTHKIFDIATCETLQICATSSADGTIRIWDNQNDLLKILEVSISAKHIAFSSLRGDLVFSARKHLYRLSHKNYLSREYCVLIMTKNIDEEMDEDLKLDDHGSGDLNEEKVKALHPVSSVPLGSLDPTSDPPRLDLMLQEQMCLQLEYRDNDILKIKKGTLKAKKLLKKKADMKIEDWEKHVAEAIGTSTKVEKEGILPHNIWGVMEEYSNFKKIPNNPQDDGKCPKILDGFLPNSSIVKVVGKENFTPPTLAELPIKETVKYIYPPEVGQLQLSPDIDEPLTLPLSENLDATDN